MAFFDIPAMAEADPEELARMLYDDRMGEPDTDKSTTEHQDKLLFTQQDIDSATWKKIRAFLRYQLMQCREQNDNNLDTVDTATQRGSIAIIKALLALENIHDQQAGTEGPNLGY